MNDIGDDTFQVAIAFTEIEGTESSRTFAMMGVGFEHRASSLTLSSDHTTHFDGFRRFGGEGKGEGEMGSGN
jgi:hypothetical protein